MRASPPVVTVDGAQLVVRTELTSDHGPELAPLVVRIPLAQADLLDPTATASASVLATVAAARGEDLVIEGPVDERAAAGAAAVAPLLAAWWGTGPVRVTVEETYVAPRAGTGVGLLFGGGADSWSTLLDLLAAPDGERVTHLMWVHHGRQAGDDALESALAESHHRLAAELGVEVATVATSARDLLDPHRRWVDVFGPVLVGTAMHLGGGLGRVVLTGDHPIDVHSRTGSDPDIVAHLGRTGLEVVLGNPNRARGERLAHLLTSPIARETLHVCWEGGTESNCGHCIKCLLTMSELAIAGDPDPSAGFDRRLAAAAVRAVTLGPVMAPFMAALVNDLPPVYEDVRRAWSDRWDAANAVTPRPRWGDDDPPGLAGPGVPERVATALRATTGQVLAPAPAPLGWRGGTVALRPRAALDPVVRARAAEAPDRPVPWAVVEHQVRDGAVDGHQADLAHRLSVVLGAGVTYTPGLVSAPDQEPVLGPLVVARLLAVCRARLWWRAEGDLEPLRVVESIEHGCLPLQVMPPGPARDLAGSLPRALAALVVADDDLAELDLGPHAVAARLAPAVAHVLTGSAEHDLLAGAHR